MRRPVLQRMVALARPNAEPISTMERAPMWAGRMMWVAWPAFLAAGMLEIVVFAVVDPAQMQWAGQALPWSRQAAYSIAFFVFWIVAMVACSLTAMLAMAPWQVNARGEKGETPDNNPDLDD